MPAPSPGRPALAALPLLALGLAATAGATPLWPVVFEEGWEDGMAGWTADPGAGEVVCEAPGRCHLHVRAARAGATTSVRGEVPAPAGVPLQVAVSFRGTSTEGHADHAIEVLLDDGNKVVLGLTGGAPPENNRLHLVSTGLDVPALDSPLVPRELSWIGYVEALDRSLTDGTWDRAGVWYRAIVEVDPAAHVATARVLGPDGAEVMRSTPVQVGLEATRVAGVRFAGVDWGSPTPWSPQFGYDDLEVRALVALR